ncbi:hypothetical protein LTR62_007957 [Meristemomyces frigidus]|uniref:Elongation of fatty acids protein n=1 Tax=Meristemomyces frigidus TaxID=1508187 RepID=A0AAN7TUZ5_9PEZI|nr:hypothetical protein LTR62_007957 [Meristemomyces frigidus]
MSGPSVYLSWPNTFTPFPANLPPVLPSPVKERTFRSPFGINKNLYNAALEPWIPFAFAAVYIVTVFSLNAYNKRRGNKPWSIAKNKPFQWFVVLHNVLLAAYSFATFAAMCRAIAHTWPGIKENPNGLAGVADALCKLHGPRGLGDAATFNTTINIWETKNSLIKLGYDGNPDPTDVGRLWNEGLAFWGWMFYVSKFYEVIDTLIILAKGKRSATLQTYHHAGAMLCMWAGIRYMSPPIWMFVFINSAIHGMMYTYFTLAALGYRVPTGLKRTLTSMQIAQFVFGASYAAAHLFVAYDIPISTPYQVASIVERTVSSVSSAAAEASTTISSVIATPTASALAPLIKKFLLRAAGEEGMAERVRDERNHYITPHIEEKIEHFNEPMYETHYRTEWTKVNCIDTSGEAFAIYLNLLYLAPLTWLFARFFVRAYTQRGKPRTVSQGARQTVDSSKQAEEETERYIEKRGKQVEDEIAKHGPDAAADMRKKAADVREQLRKDVEEMKQGKFKGSRRVSDRVASFEKQSKNVMGKAKEKIDEVVDNVRSSTNTGGSGTSKEDDVAIQEDEPEEQSEQQESQDKNSDSTPDQQPKGASSRAGQDDEEASGGNRENEAPAAKSSHEAPKSQESDSQQTPDEKENQSSTATPKEKSEPAKPQSQGSGSKKQNIDSKPKNDKKDTPAKQNNEKKDTPAKQNNESQIPRPGSPAKRSSSPVKKAPAKLNQSPKKQNSRPGTSDKPKQDTDNSGKQTGSGQDKDSKKQGSSAKDDTPSSSKGQNESEEKQDANMADTQAIRPGDTVERNGPEGKADSKAQPSEQKNNDKSTEDNDDDTDAMGKSGSIIDLAREKSKDAKNQPQVGKKEEVDPTEDAEPAGEQWESPNKQDNKTGS